MAEEQVPPPGGNNMPGDKPEKETPQDLREELAVQKAIVLSQQKGFQIGDEVGYKYESKLYTVKSVEGDKAFIKPVFPGGTAVEKTVPLDELYHTDIFEQQLRML